MTDPAHPMQPIVFSEHDVPRFKPNSILKRLVDNDAIDIREVMSMDASQEDREQFLQLIGYSVGGFAELSYVSDKAVQASQAELTRLEAQRDVLPAAARTPPPDREIDDSSEGAPLHAAGPYLQAFAGCVIAWARRCPDHAPPPLLMASWAAIAETMQASPHADPAPQPEGMMPGSKHERALSRIYDLLAKLEDNLGDAIGSVENAHLLHRAIESCKYWKHPEFELKFAVPGERPEESLQKARFDAWYATYQERSNPAWDAWRAALHMDPED